MKRRDFVHSLLGLAAVPLAGCSDSTVPYFSSGGDDWRKELELYKPKEEWRALLPLPAYLVLFEEETEEPHSSYLYVEVRPGSYVCAACFLPLFTSETKYETGTGWPSFWAPIEGRLGTKPDFQLAETRIEYHCHRCGGHQGHVFDDGPLPTGKRYCNNGLSLLFVPQGEPLPELRT